LLFKFFAGSLEKGMLCLVYFDSADNPQHPLMGGRWGFEISNYVHPFSFKMFFQ